MRKKQGKIIILSIALLLMMPITVFAQEEIHIQIDTPSYKETTIAKDRSFYVLGKLENTKTLDDDAYMKVRILNDQNQEVRVIESPKKSDIVLKVSDTLPVRPGGATVDEVKKAGMPELVYDENNEDSYSDANIKCYFDDTKFNVFVYVPNDNMVDDLLFENASVLENGNYKIDITLYDGANTKLANTEQAITIGSTENKILSRFSPNTHKERITEFANENGYRMYLDAFPGYWNWEMNNTGYFAEILSSWRAADALEYVEGLVHFVIYNVKASSATYCVELAMLQNMQDIDDVTRLKNYYYQYGEPTLVNGKQSDIVSFADGDKLQLTRAEITEEETIENVYDEEVINEDTMYDLDFKDGVKAKQNSIVSIYGVSAPIQNTQSDIENMGSNAYLLHNKLASVHYTIQGDGVNLDFNKDVLLNRKSGTWDNYSEFEFKHDIQISKEMENKQLSVSLVGYDVHGNKVVGSEETFKLDTTTKKPGVETNDSSSITLYFTLLMVSGTILLIRRKKEA